MKNQCIQSFLMMFRSAEEGPPVLVVLMAVLEAARDANSSIFLVDFIIILYNHHQLDLFRASNDQSLY